MGFLDLLKNIVSGNNSGTRTVGIINGYGKNKMDGSHDHRTNKGADQTPAQKEGHKMAQETKTRRG